MAKRPDFNLSETIREYRKAHRGVKAMDAFAAIKKAHPSQKINEGTFKSTFYKPALVAKRIKKSAPAVSLPAATPSRALNGTSRKSLRTLAILRAPQACPSASATENPTVAQFRNRGVQVAGTGFEPATSRL